MSLSAITIKPATAWAVLHGAVDTLRREWAPSALHNHTIALHAGRDYGGATARARALAELAELLVKRGDLACPRWTKGAEPELWHMTAAERAAGRLTGSLLTCLDLPTSCIFATATIRIHRIPATDGAWWAWCLSDLKPVPGGVPCAGRQGVWGVSSELCWAIVERRTGMKCPGAQTEDL